MMGFMSHLSLLLLLVAGTTVVATYAPELPAHNRLSKDQCTRITQQIDTLQSRLRKGYTAKQGRRYRERMRELELERHRKC
jgi:hypothetical protein